MKRKSLTRSTYLVIIFIFVISACSGATPEDSDPTAEPTAQPSDTPVLPPTLTPTRTIRPSNTPPQTGPLATAAALFNTITLVPPTTVGGEGFETIADDDYVGLFNQAWHTVEANYVRDNFNGADWDAIYNEYLPLAEGVQSSEELWALLADLIQELDDDHSRFISPLQIGSTFDVETRNSPDPRPWSGVYIFTIAAREDENISVWCVSPGSPAEKAGIRRGDHILAVDGHPLDLSGDGISRNQLREVLLGTGGDTITLTVLQGPDEEPKDITIDLELVGGCDGDYYMLVSENPRIGYYRIRSYEGNTNEEVLAAIKDMEAESPLDGFIIDVRHNPGGIGSAVTDTLKLFAEGTVGTVGSLREGATRIVVRIRGPVVWNQTIPMVVLTDGRSHSAADYFAIYIQYLGRAVIVGMNSAGNIDAWTNFPMSDGSQIGLAYSTFLLEDGTDLEGIGVTPDIIVPLGDWGLKLAPYDIQLQAAIDYLFDLIG